MTRQESNLRRELKIGGAAFVLHIYAGYNLA
jgi:hypothetical protein